jgi:phosphotransferase system HPr (HPr) family protein
MAELKVTRPVVVINPHGLHVRPANVLVTRASQFVSRIEIVKGRERVDGKSIIGLLGLAAPKGTELLLEASGPDAHEAAEALAELFARGFTEDEELD